MNFRGFGLKALGALVVAAAVLFGGPQTAPCASAPAGTEIINKAAVSYKDANSNWRPSEVSPGAVSSVTSLPVLTIGISVSSNPVNMGENFALTITFQNEGNDAARNCSLTLDLSEFLIYLGNSGGGVYDPSITAGGQVSWALGDLPAGSGGFVTVQTRVKTPSDYAARAALDISSRSLIINTATIAATNTARAATASTVAKVGVGPNLSITKEVDDATVVPGGTLLYTLRFANTGNDTASGVTVTDTFPAGTSYLSGSATGAGLTVNPGSLSWRIDEVAPGETGLLVFAVTANGAAVAGSKITNVATARSDTTIPVNSNTVESTVVNPPAFTLTNTPESPAVPVGGTIRLKMEVTNSGVVPTGDLTLTSSLPSFTHFVSADGEAVFAPEGAGGKLVWDLGSLDPGETAVLSVVLLLDRATPAGTLIDTTATVSGSMTDELSATASVTALARTGAVLTFTDTTGAPVLFYEIGDTVCLRVSDPDRNNSPLVSDSVTAILGSASSGDVETLTLIEEGLNAGTFYGCMDSTGIATPSGDGVFTAPRNLTFTATYTDPLDDSPVTVATVWINPNGVVFDSGTLSPVAGVEVTLLDADNLPVAVPAGWQNPFLTKEDGVFSFPDLPPGEYRVEVEGGRRYQFPSAVPEGLMRSLYRVVPASKGRSFSLSVRSSLGFDIPIDPANPPDLVVEKKANRTFASIGDVIRYTVTVENLSGLPVTAASVTDVLPKGIHYKKGTSRLDGADVADPAADESRTLVWDLGDLAVDQKITLDYVTVAGAGAKTGRAVNKATAGGTVGGIPAVANTSTSGVNISEGVFTSKGTIIGKVFEDKDCDTLAGEGERGFGQIAIYMEDGRKVVTDENGLYSIPRVTAGTHVLLLDKTTIPEGFCPSPVGSRFMGDAESQFVEIFYGDLAKANFGLYACEKETPAKSSLLEELKASEPSAGKTEATAGKNETAKIASLPGELKGSTEPETPKGVKEEVKAGADEPIEKRVAAMERGLEILSPKEGEEIFGGQVTILVKGDSNAPLVLAVNGVAVGESRISKRMNVEARRFRVLEYLNVPLSEGSENVIEAFEMRPTGKPGNSRRITVKAIGKAASIRISLDPPEVPADGKSEVKAILVLLDASGLRVPVDTHITLEASAGTIVEEDSDKASAGHQVKCTGGTASFTIRAPSATGRGTVTARAGDATGTAETYFSPNLREMLIVGYGELSLTPGESRGDFDTGGRGAFFAQGKILDDVLLTASYDSDKAEDGFFSTGGEGKDTEEDYPAYGDESENSSEARSAGKLFVRLDKGKNHALYGDYETALTQNRLSAYTRTLTGAEIEGQTGKFGLYGFYSLTDRTQAIDKMRAKGVSGYYFLSRSPVVTGSERVVIETRDRDRTDSVLKSKTLTRFTDYRIDYNLGTIMFLRPVPSIDADLNPIYIIVTYESEGGPREFAVTGGRASYSPFGWLELGLTALSEEQQFEDFELLGADLTVKLPYETTLKVESAKTHSALDDGGVLQPADGSALDVELKSSPSRKTGVTAYYREIGEKFNNPSATGVSRGTVKYGVDGSVQASETVKLTGEYFNEEDNLNDMSHWGVSAGGEKTFGPAKAGIELSHEESDDRKVPSASTKTREPFDISVQTPEESTAARIFAETRLGENISVSASHKEDITSKKNNLTGVGADYRIDDSNRLYLRSEYQVTDSDDYVRTVFGAESKITENTVAYNENRMENGQSATRNVEVLGLRNRLLLAEGLSGDFSAEQQFTATRGEGSEDPDTLALTAAVEYVPSERQRITARSEFLTQTSSSGKNSLLCELGITRKLTSDLSLLADGRYFEDSTRESDFRERRVRLGLARRPLSGDRLNGLARIEYRLETGDGADNDYEAENYIASLAGNYQANAKTILSAKWAGKAVSDLRVDTYTDLVSLGVTRDLGDRFDLGGKYRILRSPSVSAVEQGGQVEAGYRVDKNIWLTAGWSFDSFDNDLTGENIEREGVFLKLRVKWPVRPGFDAGEEAKVCGGTGERITLVAANPPVEILPAVEITAAVETQPVTILPSPEIVALAENPEVAILPSPEISATVVNPPVAIMPAPNIVVTGINPPLTVLPAPEPVRIVTEDPYVSVPTSSIELKVHFDTGKADIKDEYRQEIAAVAELLVASPEVTVLIEGHTDNVGSERYNRKLSEKRALAVANRLIQWYGVAPQRIQVIGYGEARPLEPNVTDAGRAKNRRIYAVIPIGYRP
ncbi:DUF11 domain-containing protein [bacterium]|nr:MAG: DUF11 domain-containing protein [bacterium]